MHIVCFLHSNGDTGDFIGMESFADITEVFDIPVSSLIISSINADLEQWLSDEWSGVKDSWFKVQFIVYEDRLIHPSAIERFEPINGPVLV